MTPVAYEDLIPAMPKYLVINVTCGTEIRLID